MIAKADPFLSKNYGPRTDVSHLGLRTQIELSSQLFSSFEESRTSMSTYEVSNGQPVTEDDLFELARRGNLSRRALEEALRVAHFRPNRSAWQRFIQIGLLVLGAGLLVAGIFFFFAYNWNDLHRFVKLGLLQGGILLAAGVAHALGLNSYPGKIALTMASLLVGALLALFGQIYQSTADAYTLFLYWALYITPWVLVSQFAPLWLVLVALANLTLFLFWEQLGSNYETRYVGESLFVLNAVALAAWEWFQRRGVSWMWGRWWPRIVALVTSLAITFPAIEFILFRNELEGSFISNGLTILLYLFYAALVYVYYRYRTLDLMILTMLALSLIGVLTSSVSSLINLDDSLEMLVLAIVVIVQAGVAVLWLRKVGEEPR